MRRECPLCGRDGVVSRREAEAVFATGTDTRAILRRSPDLSYVCSKCGAGVE